ncbi:cytochrome bd-I oxidase subunit CydX [Parvularcula oceani]|nr:cytochrome bd-I oxidase subunit CydX [Parvularcula oceani]
MWYFAWVLGLGLAAAVGIMNAMWFELKRVRQHPPAHSRPILQEDPASGV